MAAIFNKIPLRDNYKDIHDDSVKLKAPPHIARICFLFELVLAALAFAISFYISWTAKITATVITFEPLDSYTCYVLSPRNDAKTLSTSTSEVVQFSSCRYLLDECLHSLGSSGNDVCADKNRADYVLSVAGVAATDSLCEDVLLAHGYRFCFGKSDESSLIGDNDDLEIAFPRLDAVPTGGLQDSFFFMNTSGSIHVVATDFLSVDVLSDFVPSPAASESEGDTAVYVVAEINGDETHVFGLSTAADSAADLYEIDTFGSSIYGLTVGSEQLFTAIITGTKLSISSYHFVTAAATDDKFLECGSSIYQDDGEPNPNGNYRFISIGDDGFLYAICDNSVDNAADSYFTFYQINTTTPSYEATAFKVDLKTAAVLEDDDGGGGSASFNRIGQLLQRDGAVYISTGSPYYNLIEVDLSPVPSPQPSLSPTFFPTFAPSNPPPPPPVRRRRATDETESSKSKSSSQYSSTSRSKGSSNRKTEKSKSASSTSSKSRSIKSSNEGREHHQRKKKTRELQEIPVVRVQYVTARSLVRFGAPHFDASVASEGTASVTAAAATNGDELAVIDDDDAELAAVDTTSSRRLQQDFEVLAAHNGVYMSRGFANTLYFNGGNSSYFNTTSRSIERYDSGALRGDYSFLSAMQLAYSYGVCNEKTDNYLVDPDLSSGFADYCGKKNGIYYHNNKYFSVPASCAGLGLHPTIGKIKSCAGTRAIYEKFAVADCKDSYDTVCGAAYTDNPPFSCETEENPDLLTTLGAALANASAFWAVIAVMISLSLKKIYPGGVSLSDAKQIAAMKARATLQLGVKAAIKWRRSSTGTVVPELFVKGAKSDKEQEKVASMTFQTKPVAGASTQQQLSNEGKSKSRGSKVDDKEKEKEEAEIEPDGCLSTICTEC